MDYKTKSLFSVYNWGSPKPQKWVCLNCRVVFKPLRNDARADTETVRNCGRCKNRLWFAGKAFRAPRRNDLKAWRKVAALLESGFIFREDARLAKIPDNPNALLAWRQRNLELAQQQSQQSTRWENEHEWEQKQRAAAWRAEGKRRLREVRDEARRDEN